MSTKQILIHKVKPGENIDGILTSHFVIPTPDHLAALRNLVANINSGNTCYRSSHCGKVVYSQPSHNDFLILPTDSALDRHKFFSNEANLSSFGFYGHSYGVKNILDPDRRQAMLKIQQQVNAAELTGYCDMIDGLNANLAKEKSSKWSEHFQEYTKEMYKETAAKFGERGAEILKHSRIK